MAPGARGGQEADIDLYDDNAYYLSNGSSFSWSLNIHSVVYYCYSAIKQRSAVGEEEEKKHSQEQKPHYLHEADTDNFETWNRKTAT